VKLKSHKLKDVGKAAFRVGPVAQWSGFGAVDGDLRLEIRVADVALQYLDPTSTGADHTSVLEAHRDKIFKIAAEKYQRGKVESGDIVLVTYQDVVMAAR
jgi:hypothetical protein